MLFKVFNRFAPVNEVIVPEEDTHVFSISHPRHLTLIESPLASEKDIHHGEHSHPDTTLKAAANTSTEINSSTSSRHSSHGDTPARAASAAHPSEKHSIADTRHPDEPVLKRAHEASTIQLFFDLFFVANLTTFSTVHEVDNWEALKSYLGYFGIIWFTWLQNTLFDVRFSNDSAFERICKAMQFGVMAGFAVTGPGYVTGLEPGTVDFTNSIETFRTLSLILMTSRLILAFQYGVAFAWIHSFRKAVLPMLAHIAILLTSAMIFLGLYFAIGASSSQNVLIAWYFLVALEALAILMISGQVGFLSFRRTVLVERLGLLTLIILGEGIIDMCTSINKVGADSVYTSDIIGMIICSVCTIYAMWMLYFDQVQPERMGTLRQHIWAIIHFPFHASILFVVEGLSRLSVWRKVLDSVQPLQNAVNDIHPGSDSPARLHAQLVSLNETLTQLWSEFAASNSTVSNFVTQPDLSASFTEIDGANGNATTVSNSIHDIYYESLVWVCNNFKIKAPEDGGTDEKSRADAIFNLFEVVFVYFFVFAGLNLILLGVLFLLGKRHKLRGELFSVGLRWVAGCGLCFLAIMAASGVRRADGNDSLHAFMYSAWMLPTVLIVYLTVIIVDNLLIRYVKNVVHWRLHRRASDSTDQQSTSEARGVEEEV